jgi:hypothetical protein
MRNVIINDRPFSFLLNFLIKKEKFVIIIAKVPSAILYPLMREFLYWEYLFFVFRKRNVDVFRAFRDIKKRIDMPVSLRIVNQELKRSTPAPVSLTEKNQRILYEGR